MAIALSYQLSNWKKTRTLLSSVHTAVNNRKKETSGNSMMNRNGMAQRRYSLAAARRVQSRNSLRLRLSNNESDKPKEIHWKEVFLEPKNLTRDQGEEA